ncbi:MAG: glycosyltransferase family 9 protein [Alphaproteobacteria bacterium]|nr:glycosyltransferase family 9 protein [Alphaproteobacteria bacterium]MBV8548801.1 glycosyltransferase family 9 protein [Alphaproteobacteria bacterium]
MPQSRTFKTIGVMVGLDYIGDALIKLPFLRALRHAFPDADITWITSKGPTAYSDLLREPTRHLIDQIAVTPDWLNHPKDAPHFDLLIDTRNRWKLAMAARRLPHGVFLSLALRFWTSDRRPPLFTPKRPHIVDRLLQLVELASGTPPQSGGSLPIAENFRALSQKLLPNGPVYVGFAPGAGNPVKIWPLERFIEVARQQAAGGRIPVFMLGPQETDWQKTIADALPQARFPLQDMVTLSGGQLTVEHTLAVAARLRAAVTNDSGLSHMLSAVDCPLISLFGPTSARKLSPRVTHSIVVDASRFGATDMEAIPVDHVAAMLNLLIQNC